MTATDDRIEAHVHDEYQSPVSGYQLLLRLRIQNKPGNLGKVTTAIGEMGADIGSIDIVEARTDMIIRDLRLYCVDEENARQVVARVAEIDGVDVQHASDRTFQLHRRGKIEVHNKVNIRTMAELAHVYTPGVARVSMQIHDNPDAVWSLTIKPNTIAVVTDGTAVLGLGDIGPMAAMPVMEGKSMLFKAFADIDAWPICLNTKDPDEIVRIVSAISVIRPRQEIVYSDRTGLWALIVAASAGWENYRHQADALAQYQFLRRMGVPDERIILVLADDIADSPENRDPGTVRHEVAGPNLHGAIDVDYRLDAVSPADILAILAGKRWDRLPEVIASGSGDNVFVFLSGHGGDQGLYIGVNRAAERVTTRNVLTPEALASMVASMHDDGRYRRMLVALEMCQGGVMGRAFVSPGALLLTGANAFENSLGTHYAPDLDAWLGDEFSVAFAAHAARNPEAMLGAFYRDLYLDVPGPHVSVYNAKNFGSLDLVSLSEFLRP